MKRNYTIIPLSLLLLIAMVACSNKSKGTTDSEEKQPGSTVSVPQFDADSAYRYVKAQVDFGPRVPNTAAHKACGEYLAKKLEQFGATVYNQQADLIAYDGTLLKARNIIGSYKPETKKRIVLLSHWDSRPWADADPDETKRHTPILGANDGASGVGVLLEIARQLHKQLPELGIDIVLVDAEDYGPIRVIIKRNTGGSARNTGRRTLMCRDTTHVSAFFWTWWAPKTPLSSTKDIPRNLPKTSTEKYGTPPTT